MNKEYKYWMAPEYKASKDNQLKNDLYALICPRLEMNESRGFNGHARTQQIVDVIVMGMDEWLERQKPQTVQMKQGDENEQKTLRT